VVDVVVELVVEVVVVELVVDVVVELVVEVVALVVDVVVELVVDVVALVVDVVALVVDVVVELVVDVVVELVVLLVVELVVVEVVVVTGQSGSPPCPVQVQSPALHWAIRFLVHVLACMPEKAPHAESIWVAQFFLLHAGGDAAIAEETKAPAPRSATAANVTLTFLVIVRSPYGRSHCATPFRRAAPTTKRLAYSTLPSMDF
jgi:hypothetical protein